MVSFVDMGVVQAQIQTVEEVYVLTDWAGIGKDGFASAAINGGESQSGLQPAGSPATGVALRWRNSAG